jgi:hypothetical protein
VFQFHPETTEIFIELQQINRLMSQIHLNDIRLSTRSTGKCVRYNVVQKIAQGLFSDFCEFAQNGNNIKKNYG